MKMKHFKKCMAFMLSAVLTCGVVYASPANLLDVNAAEGVSQKQEEVNYEALGADIDDLPSVAELEDGSADYDSAYAAFSKIVQELSDHCLIIEADGIYASTEEATTALGTDRVDKLNELKVYFDSKQKDAEETSVVTEAASAVEKAIGDILWVDYNDWTAIGYQNTTVYAYGSYDTVGNSGGNSASKDAAVAKANTILAENGYSDKVSVSATGVKQNGVKYDVTLTYTSIQNPEVTVDSTLTAGCQTAAMADIVAMNKKMNNGMGYFYIYSHTTTGDEAKQLITEKFNEAIADLGYSDKVTFRLTRESWSDGNRFWSMRPIYTFTGFSEEFYYTHSSYVEGDDNEPILDEDFVTTDNQTFTISVTGTNIDNGRSDHKTWTVDESMITLTPGDGGEDDDLSISDVETSMTDNTITITLSDKMQADGTTLTIEAGAVVDEAGNVCTTSATFVNDTMTPVIDPDGYEITADPSGLKYRIWFTDRTLDADKLSLVDENLEDSIAKIEIEDNYYNKTKVENIEFETGCIVLTFNKLPENVRGITICSDLLQYDGTHKNIETPISTAGPKFETSDMTGMSNSFYDQYEINVYSLGGNRYMLRIVGDEPVTLKNVSEEELLKSISIFEWYGGDTEPKIKSIELAPGGEAVIFSFDENVTCEGVDIYVNPIVMDARGRYNQETHYGSTISLCPTTYEMDLYQHGIEYDYLNGTMYPYVNLTIKGNNIDSDYIYYVVDPDGKRVTDFTVSMTANGTKVTGFTEDHTKGYVAPTGVSEDGTEIEMTFKFPCTKAGTYRICSSTGTYSQLVNEIGSVEATLVHLNASLGYGDVDTDASSEWTGITWYSDDAKKDTAVNTVAYLHGDIVNIGNAYTGTMSVALDVKGTGTAELNELTSYVAYDDGTYEKITCQESSDGYTYPCSLLLQNSGNDGKELTATLYPSAEGVKFWLNENGEVEDNITAGGEARDFYTTAGGNGAAKLDLADILKIASESWESIAEGTFNLNQYMSGAQLVLDLITGEDTTPDSSVVQGAESAITGLGNYTIGEYVDFMLNRKVVINAFEGTTEDSGYVESLPEMTDVTLSLPDDMVNTDAGKTRTYKVIQLHSDSETGTMETKVLDAAFDEATKTLTFGIDKFNDTEYVVVYTDASIDGDDDDDDDDDIDKPDGKDDGTKDDGTKDNDDITPVNPDPTPVNPDPVTPVNPDQGGTDQPTDNQGGTDQGNGGNGGNDGSSTDTSGTSGSDDDDDDDSYSINNNKKPGSQSGSTTNGTTNGNAANAGSQNASGTATNGQNNGSTTGNTTATITNGSSISQTVKDNLNSALENILKQDGNIQAGPYVRSDSDDIAVQIPNELQKTGRNYYLMTAKDNGDIVVLTNGSTEEDMFEAKGEADTDYQMLFEDGDTPLADMITESGILDTQAAASCMNHGAGLGITLIGLIAAALLARKGNKYFWGASVAGIALALVATATGSCGLDWACFAGEAVVTVAATAALYIKAIKKA